MAYAASVSFWCERSVLSAGCNTPAAALAGAPAGGSSSGIPERVCEARREPVDTPLERRRWGVWNEVGIEADRRSSCTDVGWPASDGVLPAG